MKRLGVLLVFAVACGTQDPGASNLSREQAQGGSELRCVTCPPPPPPPPPAIAVSAAPASLYVGSSSQLTATVNGAVISGVTWSVSGGGTFSSASTNPTTYYPPSSVPEQGTTVSVTASSGKDKPGSAALLVGPAALVNTFPQGLTAGIAYVNHQCGVTLSAIASIAASAVGWIVACVGAGVSGGTAIGACVAGTAAVANSVIQATSGSSFTSCGAPSTFVTGYGVDANPTLQFASGRTSFSVHMAPGWQTGADGDYGNSTNFGFYHQELLVAGYSGGTGITDDYQSQLFALPRGTACGFHHSKNTAFNPAPDAYGVGSCMGADPASDHCPVGWKVKYHFDMSSNTSASPGNGYFDWCEYQDPYGYCSSNAQATATCLATARQMGLGLLISSDTDATGVSSFGNACPTGWARTGYFDDGRGSTWGLSWCLPIPDLPQGISFGLGYFSGPSGATSLNPDGLLSSALGGQTIPYVDYVGYAAGDEVSLLEVSDGDYGAGSGSGFAHQTLVLGGVTNPAQSRSFVLPQGTACGFHHTLNTPGMTCMGFDPATGGCPSGWNMKRHFDMSSGSGYFVWCEYEDPNNYCEVTPAAGTQCWAKANLLGVTIGISSIMSPPDTANVWNGTCPTGTYPRGGPFDDGDPSGQGLAYCVAE